MKKLLLLFGLISTVSNSQQEQEVLIIDNSLQPYVVNYIKDAKRLGLDLRGYIITQIDTMRISDTLSYPRLGMTKWNKETGTANIYIAKWAQADTLMLRSTIWHELGHVMLRSPDHICQGYCDNIMSSTGPNTYGIYYDPRKWEAAKLSYWVYLNTQLAVYYEQQKQKAKN